jgi:flagellar motor switch protein FliG
VNIRNVDPGLRPPRRFHGLALAVSVLRELDPVTRNGIMAELQQKMPHLARLADHCEFLFPDFKLLDDPSLFEAFNRFGDKEWAVAWKLMDEPLKSRLLGLMRDDRRKEFLDFAAAQPKMPRSQVYAVQMHLARQARDLLRVGKLRMRSRMTVRRAEIRKNRKQPAGGRSK